MKNPWLSIVTITRDDPVGLVRTVASAAAFRRIGVEHVVVEGITSAPGALVAAPARSLPDDVQVLRHPASGISDAFNAGIAAARGEWIWCLNGGDSVDPRLTPEFLAALLANNRADVVIGGTTYAGESEPRPHPPVHLRWPPFRSWIPHPSTLVRKALFDRFGVFDERYSIAMDYEWWLRVIPTGAGADVISVPFTVFAPGGISQRPEILPVLLREQRDALRRHQAVLGRSCASLCARFLRAWGRALVARRLISSSRQR